MKVAIRHERGFTWAEAHNDQKGWCLSAWVGWAWRFGRWDTESSKGLCLGPLIVELNHYDPKDLIP